MHFVNQLDGDHIFPVDPTIMFANPNNRPAPTPPFRPFPPGYRFAQNPIPVVTHLHGGVTPSDSDGFVDSWFTKNEANKGPAFTSSTFEYFNAQLATTLWYHDHTLGMTRLTVAAGLAGAYLLRDRNDPIAPLLPSGRFEIPLLIQDRAFNDDGSIHFTQVGDNPDIHPYWDPEYFGDTIMVNGKVWPRLKRREAAVPLPHHQRVERPVLQSEAVERHVVHADRRRRQLSAGAGDAHRVAGGAGRAAGHPDRLLEGARPERESCFRTPPTSRFQTAIPSIRTRPAR